MTITFGVTVSGRPPTLRGVEGMVGLFVNTLPLAVAISPTDTLLDMVHDLQEKQVLLQQQAPVSQTQIRQWNNLSDERPLFDSIVKFQNYPLNWSELEKSTIIKVADIQWIDQWPYPLCLAALPDDVLTLQLTYSQAVFKQTKIRQILHKLQNLLDHLPQQIERHVPEILAFMEQFDDEKNAADMD